MLLQVLPVPFFYLRQHELLLTEFQNSTHWPKHLLVRYRWAHHSALNVNAAMYVLFAVGKQAVLAWQVFLGMSCKCCEVQHHLLSLVPLRCCPACSALCFTPGAAACLCCRASIHFHSLIMHARQAQLAQLGTQSMHAS